jgi:hypothetical protein
LATLIIFLSPTRVFAYFICILGKIQGVRDNFLSHTTSNSGWFCHVYRGYIDFDRVKKERAMASVAVWGIIPYLPNSGSSSGNIIAVVESHYMFIYLCKAKKPRRKVLPWNILNRVVSALITDESSLPNVCLKRLVVIFPPIMYKPSSETHRLSHQKTQPPTTPTTTP